ncbi:GtrA family protein [Sphingobium aquiterrae]|uniref:GtrA family protein n=1 Tax=Sphingobium aquiterrae TaxID=2038656 RepID=UPI00301B3EDB
MPDHPAIDAVDMPSRHAAPAGGRGIRARFFSRRAAGMLMRNSIVSAFVFALDMAILWAMVQMAGSNRLWAAALGLLVANTLHYALGRRWIFPGTDRHVASGYLYFLVNAAIGMAITMLLYAAMLRWTSIHYLVARVLVSVLAGLTAFLLNATFNFRRL